MRTNQIQQQNSQRNLTRDITLRINEYTKIFEKCVREEIEIQKQLAKKYPEFVLGIISDQNQQLKDQIKISITYNCTSQCKPILDYVKTLVDNQGLVKKIELCCQLLKICNWMKQNKIAHRNIKPSSLYVDQGKILLTDFGSQRTFYLNYCSKPTNMDEKIQKFRDCLFYSCPEILEIIKQNSDSDLKIYDLREWQDVQEDHAAIKADIWSIAIIILEIFSPIKDVTLFDINEYFGLNKKHLQDQLDKVEKNSNSTICNCLKTLLNENIYRIDFEGFIQQIKESAPNQNRLNQQGINQKELQILFTKDQSDQLPKLQPLERPQLEYQFFITLNDFNRQAISLNAQAQRNYPQLNFSIIDFGKYATQKFQTQPFYQSNINQYCPKLAEYKAKIETFKALQILSSLLLKSQVLENFYDTNDDFKSEKLLPYNVIIWMTADELNYYQKFLENLLEQFSNQSQKQKDIEKIGYAMIQLEWRINALKLLNQQKGFSDSGALIFYLNDEEYSQLKMQNSEVYSNIKQDFRNEREELQNAITDFLCFDKNSFTQEQLQNISMTVIQNTNDNLLQMKYNEKLKIKKDMGIEWFEFHKNLYSNYKYEQFLKTGDVKYILKNYAQFKALSDDRQIQYNEKLKEIIKKNEIEEYENAVFYMYEKLPNFDTVNNKIMSKMQFSRNEFNLTQLNTNISEVIKAFASQMLLQSMKISMKYENYFRKLKNKQINNVQQRYKNDLVNSVYYGNNINDIPNGYGFSVLNEKTVLIGIYRNKKLIKGWSIIQKRKNIFSTALQFNKGQFCNGLLNGKGCQKIFIVNEVNNTKQFQLIKLRLGLFQDGKLQGYGTKIIYKQQQDNIYFIGQFNRNQMINGIKKVGINGVRIPIPKSKE